MGGTVVVYLILHYNSSLLEALVLYLDSVLIILLMVQLAPTRTWEEEAVLNGNSLQLGHVRHGGWRPGVSLIFSVRVSFMKECFSIFATFVSAWIIASLVLFPLLLSLQGPELFPEKELLKTVYQNQLGVLPSKAFSFASLQDHLQTEKSGHKIKEQHFQKNRVFL